MTDKRRRRIKFRAKLLDSGEWVYGGGVIFNEVRDQVIMLSIQDDDLPVIYHVDPETVGEFIGLKDNNKKEIYEGDILQWDNELYKIVYDQAMAQFNHRPIDPYGHDDYFELENNKRQEVIGNIHDNPELMDAVDE